MEEQVVTKTIEEWLNELDEPYRSQAIKNFTELNGDDFNDMFGCKAERMTGALAKAFVWDDSPEKHEYWEELYSKYLDK